jgi:hypothetical protein
MTLSVGIVIYSTIVAFISSLMVYYYRVRYPQEEAKLKENSK